MTYKTPFPRRMRLSERRRERYRTDPDYWRSAMRDDAVNEEP